MIDAPPKPVLETKERIDVRQDREVREWAKALGVQPNELLRAVHVVGEGAARVQRFLKNQAV